MYNVINNYKTTKNKTKINFYYIEIVDIKKALKDTYETLSNASWIDKLSDEALKNSYKERLNYTIESLHKLFQEDTKLSESTGEYLISAVSKNCIVDNLKYSDIPLGEVIGKRTRGNGGFDYYTENNEEFYILFGEAKYKNKSSAYSNALDQIIEFINQKKDIADYADIVHFISEKAKKNMEKGIKGYAAGFSFIGYDEKLINKIINNPKYDKLLQYKELLLIGVKIKYE